MAINFPDNRDQLVPPQPSGPIQTGDVYVYNGTTYVATVLGDSSVRWDAAVSAGSDAYVLKVGDTMTGQLTLPGGGTGNEAATVSQIPVVPAALWQRDGGTSTLSPVTANDNLNQGTGDISGGNVQASGFTNALGGSYSRTGDTNNKLFIGQQTDFTEVFSVSNTGDVVAAGDVQTTSLNSGPLAGFRNAIINGDFRVWQRGTSVVFGASNGGYTADRWGTAANTTTSQRGKYGGIPVAELLGAAYLLQGVELYVDPFSGTPSSPFTVGSVWTLSYYATKAPDGAVSNIAQFRDSANDGTPASNPVDIATISTPTATGETLGSGNELVRYSTTFTITGTPATTNRCAVFHIAGNSNDVDFACAQLEPGPVATPFEARPIGTELALCQRYYETVGTSFVHGVGADKTEQVITIPYKVQKRALPTTIANYRTNVIGAGTKVDSVGISNNALHVVWSTTSTTRAGFKSTNNNSAGLAYEIDAEL